MSLYNLHSADGQWAITKFDNDLNVESSYITSELECSCPAGSCPTCRHRQMLPKMLHVGAEDSGMFYDFDHDQFLEPLSDADDTQPVIVSPVEDVDTETVYVRDYLNTVEATATAGGPLTGVPATKPPAITPTFKAGELKPDFSHPAMTGTLKRRI